MKHSLVLLTIDIKAIKDWFSTQTISKLLVLLGFLVVLLTVFLALFSFSNFYFKTLSDYEVTGFLTATYILKASLIVVLWLGIGSSIVSTATAFLAPRNLDHLLALPIKPVSIVFWMFLKTTLVNVVFFFVTLAPTFISFALAFHAVDFSLIVRLTFILFTLSILTNGIGTILAFLLIPKLKGKGYLAALIGLIFFLISTFAILHLVFPPEIHNLHSVTAQQFNIIYQKLPISHPLLPINWLVNTFIEGFSVFTLYLLAFACLIALISLLIQSKKLVFLYQTLSVKDSEPLMIERKFHHNQWYVLSGATSYQQKLSNSRLPVLLKDWLSIVRSTSEIGYAIFLSALAFFSLLFFLLAGDLKELPTLWKFRLTFFSFTWLIFFTTAYLLRLVFPLMAREGESAWYIFTQPITPPSLLLPKVYLGVLLSLPLLAISLIIWSIIPYLASWRILLLIFSFLAIVILAVSQAILGSIFPNFSASKDPEKVSTSGMGLFTLTVSFLIGFSFIRGIDGIIVKSVSVGKILAILLLFYSIFLIILYKTAVKFMRQYEF